jgi:DNA-binding transcriptional ArsR family regulator
MPEHPLPPPVVELVAERFRALGEPLRIRLVEQLMEGEASVRELVSATGAGQQNVSKHLGVLLHAGVVGRRKQGTLVFYRIIDDVVYSLCEQVCASLERQHAQLGELFASDSPRQELTPPRNTHHRTRRQTV